MASIVTRIVIELDEELDPEDMDDIAAALGHTMGTLGIMVHTIEGEE